MIDGTIDGYWWTWTEGWADRKGDPSKAPPECNSFTGRPTDCKNLVDVTPRSMDSEHYVCEVCGRDFTLYYDKMR